MKFMTDLEALGWDMREGAAGKSGQSRKTGPLSGRHSPDKITMKFMAGLLRP